MKTTNPNRIVCSDLTKLKFDKIQGELSLEKKRKVDHEGTLLFLIEFYENTPKSPQAIQSKAGGN
jgi:hypothetical protein